MCNFKYFNGNKANEVGEHRKLDKWKLKTFRLLNDGIVYKSYTHNIPVGGTILNIIIAIAHT